MRTVSAAVKATYPQKPGWVAGGPAVWVRPSRVTIRSMIAEPPRDSQ